MCCGERAGCGFSPQAARVANKQNSGGAGRVIAQGKHSGPRTCNSADLLFLIGGRSRWGTFDSVCDLALIVFGFTAVVGPLGADLVRMTCRGEPEPVVSACCART
jgi:hypothetical protein